VAAAVVVVLLTQVLALHTLAALQLVVKVILALLVLQTVWGKQLVAVVVAQRLRAAHKMVVMEQRHQLQVQVLLMLVVVVPLETSAA
jgi:hypothetical protein